MTHETTCFTPAKLETVDQVNALPIGTVAKRVKKYESFWDSYDIYDAAIKDESGWIATPPEGYLKPEDFIGWTAFVPAHQHRKAA